MKLTYDDKWLLTVSNDGTLGIWKVTDKDGRLLQSDEELPFLEEILITRADLEEKASPMMNSKSRFKIYE